MLSKKKDKTKGKCPFNNFKPCNEECVFFRSGVRYNEKSEESFPFEECAINIIADNIEAMHNRTYQMQKEVGETKNVMAMKILSDLGKIPKDEMVRIVTEQIPIKQLEDKKE